MEIGQYRLAVYRFHKQQRIMYLGSCLQTEKTKNQIANNAINGRQASIFFKRMVLKDGKLIRIVSKPGNQP